MQYQILVYQKKVENQANSLATLQQWREACRANNESLAERGYLITKIDLGPQREGLRIELRNDELILENNDARYEQEELIRVMQIEAYDLNHALQIATAMPELRFSRLELRSSAENDALSLQEL
jgi:Uncharacterized protein conserved in bacteria